MLKRMHSSSPSSHRGKASYTGNTVQDLRDDVDLLDGGHVMVWVLLPRCPSDLGNPADHLPNDF